MDLPKTIRVGVADFKVLRKKNPSDGNDNVLGWFKMADQELCVGTRMSDLRQVETFVHELLHCLMNEAGLHEQGNDHGIIDPLTISLMHFLMENDLGWLNKYFKEKWNERYR